MPLPYTLQNGPGNPPDAAKFNANYAWLFAVAHGSATKNGGFESWAATTSHSNPANGTTILPHWTLRKSGGTPSTTDVSRESTNIDEGTYSVKFDLTGAGSADSLVALDQSLSDVSRFRSLTLSYGLRIKTATANKIRLKITDGSTTQYSSYHTGGNTWELLEVTITVAAAAASITISVEVTSDFTGTAYVDGAFVYSVPSDMTSAARAFLRYSALLELVANDDIYILAPGKGLVCTSPDGSKTARWSLDDEGIWAGTPL
jgi:hypothetical protein